MRPALQKVLDRARSVPKSVYLVAALLALLTIARLVIVSNQGMSASGGALEDDTLFVKLGFYIKHGLWLGPFDARTLVKGPVYPMWIALVATLGAPLLLAQQVLYTASCALFAWVMGPALRTRKAAAALYVVLLLSPIAFADGPFTRALREGIYVSLTLLVLACAIALWTRAQRPVRSWAGWAIGLGATAAAFWLTREEGVWLVPVLLLPAASAAMALRGKPRDWRGARKRLVPWGVAAVIALGCVGAVAANNQRIYGTYKTVDTVSGPFLSAYGALTRITPDHWVRDVPVTRDARIKAYSISPSFAQLQPSLEGTIGVNWIKIGGGDDLRGGWFSWALRDAAASVGHYRTATEADAYFQRVADEINTACDAGLVACVGPRATLMPPLRTAYLQPFASAAGRSGLTLARWGGIGVAASPSTVPTDVAYNFRAMTNENEVGNDPVPPLRPTATAALSVDLSAYQLATPIALVLALAGFVLALVPVVRKNPGAGSLNTAVMLTALLACVLSRIVLVSLVDATSFPAVSAIYLAPAFDIMLVWIFISAETLAREVRKRLADRASS